MINRLQHDLTKETFISENPFRQTWQSERPFWETRVGLFSSVEMLLWEELHTKLPPAAPRAEYQIQTCGPNCIVLHRIRSLFVWDGKFEGRGTRDSSLSCSWDSLSCLWDNVTTAFDCWMRFSWQQRWYFGWTRHGKRAYLCVKLCLITSGLMIQLETGFLRQDGAFSRLLTDSWSLRYVCVGFFF